MVQRLAGEKAVADMTLLIPHPYPDGAAETWIATHAPRWAAQEELVFAITTRSSGELVGAVGLIITLAQAKGELGYWIGIPYWNRGYATEALQTLIDYGFRSLELSRIQAHHMAINPASGRVMEKAGLRREGYSPSAMIRNGEIRDAVFYGLDRADWL